MLPWRSGEKRTALAGNHSVAGDRGPPLEGLHLMATFHPKLTLATGIGHAINRELNHFEARLLKPHDGASDTAVRGVAVSVEERTFSGSLRQPPKLSIGGYNRSVHGDRAIVALPNRAHV